MPPDTTPNADGSVPIKLLHDRVLVREDNDGRERRSIGGIVIPVTAQVGRRLAWAKVVALGPNVRSLEIGDRVLFEPEERGPGRAPGHRLHPAARARHPRRGGVAAQHVRHRAVPLVTPCNGLDAAGPGGRHRSKRLDDRRSSARPSSRPHPHPSDGGPLHRGQRRPCGRAGRRPATRRIAEGAGGRRPRSGSAPEPMVRASDRRRPAHLDDPRGGRALGA